MCKVKFLLSEQAFTKQQVESLVSKLSEFGNNLEGNERKLLDLLIAGATRVITIRGTEELHGIKDNLSEAISDALERFVGASNDLQNDNCPPSSCPPPVYAWNR